MDKVGPCSHLFYQVTVSIMIRESEIEVRKVPSPIIGPSAGLCKAHSETYTIELISLAHQIVFIDSKIRR
jgi:hypothetical protein